MEPDMTRLVAARVVCIESIDDAMYRLLYTRLNAARTEAVAQRERTR